MAHPQFEREHLGAHGSSQGATGIDHPETVQTVCESGAVQGSDQAVNAHVVRDEERLGTGNSISTTIV